jgi:hypothetical protein
MLYRSNLKKVGQKNLQPQREIQNSLKGVDFDYFFTGRREGNGGQIELHITSVVTDWATNTFTRQSIYRGHKEHWRES